MLIRRIFLYRQIYDMTLVGSFYPCSNVNRISQQSLHKLIDKAIDVVFFVFPVISKHKVLLAFYERRRALLEHPVFPNLGSE